MIVSDLWFRRKNLKLGLEGKRAQFCSQKGAWEMTEVFTAVTRRGREKGTSRRLHKGLRRSSLRRLETPHPTLQAPWRQLPTPAEDDKRSITEDTDPVCPRFPQLWFSCSCSYLDCPFFFFTKCVLGSFSRPRKRVSCFYIWVILIISEFIPFHVSNVFHVFSSPNKGECEHFLKFVTILCSCRKNSFKVSFKIGKNIALKFLEDTKINLVKNRLITFQETFLFPKQLQLKNANSTQ